MDFVFNALPLENPWKSAPKVEPIPRPDFADNEELKKAFGIALARGLNSFEAGCEVLIELPKGLWASTNWINDPVVHAAKDAYLKSLKQTQKPLDKEELLAEVLERARNSEEDKDAAALFKLYSEIAGYTGKQSEVTANFNNTTNNVMEIRLVGGSEKPKLLDASPDNSKSRMLNDELMPKLKLVGGSR